MHQVDCSAVRTLLEKMGNVIVGPVQLAFLTFHIDQITCCFDAGGIKRHSSLKRCLGAQPSWNRSNKGDPEPPRPRRSPDREQRHAAAGGLSP